MQQQRRVGWAGSRAVGVARASPFAGGVRAVPSSLSTQTSGLELGGEAKPSGVNTVCGPYFENPVNTFPVASPMVPMLMSDGRETMVSVKQYLYTNRMVFVDKAITEDMASRLCADLLYMEQLDPKADITMYIHTKAISMYALNAIVDVMKYVQSDVATVCIGTVAGVASTVLAAGER